MPIYEYVCGECGKYSEALQRLSDPPRTECPSCHAQALVKQISAVGFRLKGGGWYETDFKSDGKRNLADDGAEKPDPSVKPAGADAKPAESGAATAGPPPASVPAAAPSAPPAGSSSTPA